MGIESHISIQYYILDRVEMGIREENRFSGPTLMSIAALSNSWIYTIDEKLHSTVCGHL